MATAPESPVSPPPPSSPDEEAPRTFIDYPDADIILRSCDSQEFRVLKLYIVKCSPVLSERIQAISISDPSRPAVLSDVGTPLPVVQLSDAGPTISYLLTFIFPVPPILPLTLEEILELLSVAQKYGMASVLAHIRLCVESKDPPLICPENAFLVFPLAQEFGLREEAAKAAKISLAFTLTIENLQGRSDIPQGVYLSELWKYHQNVRSNLLSSNGDFRGTAAGGTFTGLTCLSRTQWGSPQWLDDYIVSITQTPSCFDPLEFQTTLACHVRNTGCSWCTQIPRQTMRTFWTALTNFVNENIAKASSINMSCFEFCNEYTQAELSLSVPCVWHEARLRDRDRPAVVPPLSEALDISGADLVIRSSDFVQFRVHKSILVSASQFFKDMFSLPQPSDETVNGLPILHMSEDAELVRALITMLYPIPSEIPVAYDKAISLLAASQKYDMPAVQSSIRAEISYRKLTAQSGDQAFRAYAIASRNRLSPETSTIAHLTLDYPMTLETLGTELQELEGWALGDLATFRKCRRDDIVACFESYLDVQCGPSKIWAGCPENKSSYSKGLPAWLSNVFRGQITELNQTFTNPLLEPSSIRKKYSAALRSHSFRRDSWTPPKECEFCFCVHGHQREEYCTELERKLTFARDKASSALTFLSVFLVSTCTFGRCLNLDSEPTNQPQGSNGVDIAKGKLLGEVGIGRFGDMIKWTCKPE
jgi:hypothetical protein